ncbi:DUF4365 domain-containing protein [Amycolatopsis pittospori]|uniref:DUF4365 domain-containing protein n=1 Tax=Amycolatopsis pittospori TaxID=2749434 RepID=UPI0015EFE4F9|nr:DUF4365 domain-containing protein [Amycolatopsis pittospori]
MYPYVAGTCAWVIAVTALFPSVHASGVPYGRLQPNLCKEQISIAYTHTVATAARCKLQDVTIDDHGVDGILMQTPPDELLGNVKIDVQLKCTASDSIKDDHVAFQLPRFNYDNLRGEHRLDPAILIVMVVPPNLESWVAQDEDALTVVRCAYWASLRGFPAINQDSKVVHLPRENIFNVESLLVLMERASKREPL